MIPRPSRRFPLGLLIATVMFASATSPAAAGDIVLDEVASGLAAPVYVDAPFGDSRLFIVEQAGVIRILAGDSVLPTPFLDIRSIVRSGGEQGLLGLAFHPDFPMNGRFFVHYTNTYGDTVIAEYTVGTNPNRADASSRRVLLTVDQPASNHNGGSIAFGPDDNLYVALGDGGGGNDTYGNGQNTTTLPGSILRISPDTGNAAPGNPYGRIWAYGLRNPWRMSFDTATGALYVGDVGQGAREEVTVVTGAGANLGWPILEGTICRPPTTSCTPPVGYVGPILDYQKPGPRSVTGGYVYRGAELPSLVGTYFYADVYAGFIKSFRNLGGVATAQKDWTSQLGTVPYLVSFGTDGDNELYVVSLSGTVQRFVEGATRVAGPDRYATSAVVSQETFPAADVAYIVTGDNWPDALIAASRGDGPVLLTRTDTLPGVARSELDRLGPLDEIFVVGGTAAVSAAVVSQLGAYAGKVTRIAGSDRYATTSAFSQRFHATASTVYIATGENHPDALVTAAAAGHTGAPLLLVERNRIPGPIASELARLAPGEIVVVGGESVISPSVLATLGSYATTVRRVAGPDRYATAAAVAADTFSGAGSIGNRILVATGLAFPDALVAAAGAINENSPVLLVTDTSVPAPTARELSRLAPSDVLLVGGVSAVDRQTQADLGTFFD